VSTSEVVEPGGTVVLRLAAVMTASQARLLASPELMAGIEAFRRRPGPPVRNHLLATRRNHHPGRRPPRPRRLWDGIPNGVSGILSTAMTSAGEIITETVLGFGGMICGPGRMILQPVERLACAALPGSGPACLEPGVGEALTCMGELLSDQADGAFPLPLGPVRGVGSLGGLGHCLLRRRDDSAAALPFRLVPGVRQRRSPSPRAGPGPQLCSSRPASVSCPRISHAVDAAIFTPRPASSPWILR
jgi:hypothetical protein